MAKKTAPTKAKELDASPDAIHAELKTLIDSLMLVAVLSEAIERIYDDLWKQKQSCGMPKANEWPNSPEFEHRRAQYDDWVKEQQAKFALNGESWSPCEFQEFPWTKLIREWSACYQTWCAAMATAKQAAIIYLGKLRPARKWTTKTIVNLDNLADTLHPSGTGGVDGLGFIRCGLPPLPTAFHACVAAVRKRIPKLRAISVLAVATPTKSDDAKATRLGRQMQWLAEAMLMVHNHPEWLDAAIAKRVGIDKSRLSRSSSYQSAARMARTNMTPAGQVTVSDDDRELDAEDDSLDLNQQRSRQSQDEEDTDDRIDREIKETQRKAQHGQSNPP